jgi:hypothetical protein
VATGAGGAGVSTFGMSGIEGIDGGAGGAATAGGTGTSATGGVSAGVSWAKAMVAVISTASPTLVVNFWTLITYSLAQGPLVADQSRVPLPVKVSTVCARGSAAYPLIATVGPAFGVGLSRKCVSQPIRHQRVTGRVSRPALDPTTG